MTVNAASLCIELRARLGAAPDSADLQPCYEAWAKQPEWRLDTEAVPVIVGVPPEAWAARLAAANAGNLADVLTRLAADALGCAPDEARPAMECYQWARGSAIPLAGHLDQLMQFVASALQPASANDLTGAGPEPQAGGAVEVLGAALRLLARERARCSGADGRPEAERIVDLMLATAAHTFGEGRAPMVRQEMVALLTRWL